MAFETFDSRRRPLVQAALTFAKARYGKNGLNLEQPIDSKIRWRPTFWLKPNAALITAFEYNDVLYPDSLDGAIVDIGLFDRPVTVYQLCPLSTFLGDKHQVRTKQLTDRGIGIITIDDDTKAVALQKPGVPLGQHIPEDEFAKLIRALSQSVKVQFRGAYDTFGTKTGPGLQEAGQIVEAMIRRLHDYAADAGAFKKASPVANAATLTDALYSYGAYSKHRSVLGGARRFLAEYRNIVSHPQRTAKQAIDKIRKCRAGFLEAITLAVGLTGMARDIGCRMTIVGS